MKKRVSVGGGSSEVYGVTDIVEVTNMLVRETGEGGEVSSRFNSQPIMLSPYCET